MSTLPDQGKALQVDPQSSGPAEGDVAEWCANARAALDGVIRRSVEMRLVATLTAEERHPWSMPPHRFASLDPAAQSGERHDLTFDLWERRGDAR